MSKGYDFRQPYGCMYFANTQVVAHNSFTKITANPFNNADRDSDMVNTGSSQLDIPETGVYLIGGSIRFAVPGVNLVCGGAIYKNGSVQELFFFAPQNPSSESGAALTRGSSKITPLTAGDYLDLRAYWQYAGGAGNHTVLGGSQAVFIFAKKLG